MVLAVSQGHDWGWRMRSQRKQRTTKLLFLVLILALSAAWAGADPAPAEQKPASRTRVAPQRAFNPADPGAKAVVLLSKPASYELPIQDPLTEMHAEARCSRTVPRGIDVTLSWSSKRAGVEAHRVDLTEFGSGFESGRFLTSGERPTSVKELPFEEALPGIYYYWRVLTKTADGWIVSGTGRFDSPICPADEREEEE